MIDADRILVMQDGVNREYDHPFKLLCENPDTDTQITKEGVFSHLVKATGEENEKGLFNIARQKYL